VILSAAIWLQLLLSSTETDRSVDECNLAPTIEMSSFEPNAVIRGAQLTVVGSKFTGLSASSYADLS
jgi:hypothetical protein